MSLHIPDRFLCVALSNSLAKRDRHVGGECREYGFSVRRSCAFCNARVHELVVMIRQSIEDQRRGDLLLRRESRLEMAKADQAGSALVPYHVCV